jgi:transposase
MVQSRSTCLIERAPFRKRPPLVLPMRRHRVIRGEEDTKMAKAHPTELRDRVVAAHKRGEGSFAALAKRFDVGEASVNRWVARKRNFGTIEPKPMGGARRPRIVDVQGENMLRDVILHNPDCYLRELCEVFQESSGRSVSPQTMSRVLKRMGITRKKGLFDQQHDIDPK